MSDPRGTAARVAALDTYAARGGTRWRAIRLPTRRRVPRVAPWHVHRGSTPPRRHPLRFNAERRAHPHRRHRPGVRHGPAHVSLRERAEMILSLRSSAPFLRRGRLPARNPHMRGTTSLLRCCWAASPGRYAGEFIDLAGAPVHVFEMFALVNFLLCSAITKPDAETSGVAGVAWQRARWCGTARRTFGGRWRFCSRRSSLCRDGGSGVARPCVRRGRGRAAPPEDGARSLRRWSGGPRHLRRPVRADEGCMGRECRAAGICWRRWHRHCGRFFASQESRADPIFLFQSRSFLLPNQAIQGTL